MAALKTSFLSLILAQAASVFAVERSSSHRCFLYGSPAPSHGRPFTNISVGSEFAESNVVLRDLWDLEAGMKALKGLQSRKLCPEATNINPVTCFIYEGGSVSLGSYSPRDFYRSYEIFRSVHSGLEGLAEANTMANALKDLGQCDQIKMQ